MNVEPAPVSWRFAPPAIAPNVGCASAADPVVALLAAVVPLATPVVALLAAVVPAGAAVAAAGAVVAAGALVAAVVAAGAGVLVALPPHAARIAVPAAAANPLRTDRRPTTEPVSRIVASLSPCVRENTLRRVIPTGAIPQRASIQRTNAPSAIHDGNVRER